MFGPKKVGLNGLRGTHGNVAFTAVADSEAELREFISRDSPGADFIQFGGNFRKTVSESLSNNIPIFEIHQPFLMKKTSMKMRTRNITSMIYN